MLQTAQQIIPKDCVLMTVMWLYFMKQNHGKRNATEVKRLKGFARKLKATDMDRYWLFCYEALTFGSLSGQWRTMKKANVSFIRKEIFDVTAAAAAGSD